MGEIKMFEAGHHAEIPTVNSENQLEGEVIKLNDVELKGYDDVELIDFGADVEAAIIKQLFALKYGKEADIRKLSPEEQEKVDVIVLMAMRMHEEDRKVTPESLAQVAVQEYFEGNNGSKPWILK